MLREFKNTTTIKLFIVHSMNGASSAAICIHLAMVIYSLRTPETTVGRRMDDVFACTAAHNSPTNVCCDRHLIFRVTNNETGRTNETSNSALFCKCH